VVDNKKPSREQPKLASAAEGFTFPEETPNLGDEVRRELSKIALLNGKKRTNRRHLAEALVRLGRGREGPELAAIRECLRLDEAQREKHTPYTNLINAFLECDDPEFVEALLACSHELRVLYGLEPSHATPGSAEVDRLVEWLLTDPEVETLDEILKDCAERKQRSNEKAAVRAPSPRKKRASSKLELLNAFKQRK
jgi:hypothetical protein